MKLRWRLHSYRYSHDRRMAIAESHVEEALMCKRLGKELHDQQLLFDGFNHLRRAIAVVVKCGCPESMWRPKVRKHIGVEK